MTSLRDQLTGARAASLRLAGLTAVQRRGLLEALAAAYDDPANQDRALAANAGDVERARQAEARGELAPSLVARLVLDEKKFAALTDGLRQLAHAPELVGRLTTHRRLDDGLVLRRVTCPLGVLGVVFEARPDALVQITGLAWKSGNALVLKGGKEALETNRVLCDIARKVMTGHGLSADALVLIEDRAGVAELLAEHDRVDMMIARGSSEFIRHVRANTRIPVMAHADGICHIYLHGPYDAGKAARILVDAKTSYPSACNSVETLLWNDGAAAALDGCVAALGNAGVELRGCAATRARHPGIKAATEADWDTEYGALILSIKKVGGLDDALAHIAAHGSRHTDAIVTEDRAAAARFLAEVDSACCFHNASTRFADGYRFGLGAEVGISTDKLHARGPVGVEGLLTYRWLLEGDGQVSTDYGDGKRAFKHEDV